MFNRSFIPSKMQIRFYRLGPLSIKTEWAPVIAYFLGKTNWLSLQNVGRNNQWRSHVRVYWLSVWAYLLPQITGQRGGKIYLCRNPACVCSVALDTHTHSHDSWANDVCVTSISPALAVCHQSHSNSVETGVCLSKIEFPKCPRRQPNAHYLWSVLFVSASLKVALPFFGCSHGRSKLWMSHAA